MVSRLNSTHFPSALRLLAFVWIMVAAPQLRAAGESPEALLRQVENLRNSGDYAEAMALVESVLDPAGSAPEESILVEALYQKALLHYFQQDYDQARVILEVGRSKAKDNGFKGQEADFLSAEGVLEWKLGNLSLATPKLEAALEIQKEREQWVNMASISNNLGIIAYAQKDYTRAVGHYEQGLAWLADRDNDRMEASLYSNLAEVLIPLGELEQAERHLFAALEIEKRIHEPVNLAYTYFNLGELNAKRGDGSSAQSLFRHALSLQQSIGDEWAISLTLLKLGEELFKDQQTDAALVELETGFALAKHLNARTLLRDYTEVLRDIHMELGNTGLSEFHAIQHEDLVRRIEGQDAGAAFPFAEAGLSPARESGDKPLTVFGLYPLQLTVIVLLSLLIALLFLENARLRKALKDL